MRHIVNNLQLGFNFHFYFYHFWHRCPCRNTSHSNGWAVCQTKPFLDNTASHGSELWLSDYNKQFYRYSSNSNHHHQQPNVNQHTKQLSGDHRIRITVNCGDEYNTFSDQNRTNNNSNEESESGASVTIVEIDDSQQSDDDNDDDDGDDDTNTPPNIIRNTLHVTPTERYINSSVKEYNEKPIDVPEEFERKAYEFQRNEFHKHELSPFVRNLQPNSQVTFAFYSIFLLCFPVFCYSFHKRVLFSDLSTFFFLFSISISFYLQRQRKRFPPPRKPIKTPIENTTETMGNGCSKNIRRLNKNTVAPNHIASTSTPVKAEYAEPIKFHRTHNLANKSNHTEVTPSTSTSINQRINQTTTPRLELSNHTGKTDARNPLSSSNRKSEAFDLASCIDTKSIIFDKSETKPPIKPSFVRSASVDSSSDKSVQSSEVRKFTAHLHRLFKSNQNLTNTTTTPNATHRTNDSNISFPKLYHRFSGSVQSLFSGNLNNNRKRNLSASDTNLNRINRCAMTQQQLIDNDYCPSVLYNRKARKSCSEKNLDKTQTFSRWKNQLWMKFSRKKSDPSARKS